jgi:hypothetical protein
VFAWPTPADPVGVNHAGHSEDMPAEVFTLIGLATVALLGVARWWEER